MIGEKIKNQIQVNNPWRYSYTDNFLSDMEFNKLQSDMIELAKDDNPKLEDRGSYKKFPIDTIEYYNTYNGLFINREFWGETVGKTVTEKSIIKGYGVCIDPGINFDIHPDVPEKTVTGVLYVAPNENNEDLGTWIYEEGNTHEHQSMDTCVGKRNLKLDHKVKWIPNRFITFGVQPNTWHNYSNMGTQGRITMVFNLYAN